ncbi:MAG: multiheme c-type cytochrome, partial [Gammaproteobacteria bacterium]|nr:multiheme c-type cytochrome [Gammaproteobacteria bacterium]
MKKTISSLFLAGLSIIFSQACLADDGRTDLTGPGDAEVEANTGYQHTLFDSADQKCQHCHNDLYDTWKTSMHAKSWVDPIFMSKYQDFLRLQASKIGIEGP